MADDKQVLDGPDLEAGVFLTDIPEGKPLLGHAHGEQVVVVRQGEKVFAVGSKCTHYGGPLAEGIVADGTIRCPWHHSRFNLATGEPFGPALRAVECWDVAHRDGKVCVSAKRPRHVPDPPTDPPNSVIIIGGGAAGTACVETLRYHGYHGAIVMIAADEPYPVDRPSLSKSYLNGETSEEDVPLLGLDFAREYDVEFVRARVAKIDTDSHAITLESGAARRYDALLLATGASPRSLKVPGAELPHVHMLRTLNDGVELREHGERAANVVVIGTGFIGLEVAASLRQWGASVTVVGREDTPMEHALGEELGLAVQEIHEQHGVQFCLHREVTEITADGVLLDNGKVVPADLVVIGIGVDPRTELAEGAGLDVEDGVLVDRCMRTSAPRVWAAGDIARYPYNGSTVRIEHWTVAERQGQAVAMDILGEHRPFHDAPFFWTRQFDTSIDYVGHANGYDEVQIVGSLSERDATVVYRQDGNITAVATMGRSQVALRAEWALEHGDQQMLESIVRQR